MTTTLGAIAKGTWKWVRQATSTDEDKREALHGDDWDEGDEQKEKFI